MASFARQFALLHPGFVLAIAAGAGAYLYWRNQQTKDAIQNALGTPADPNYAFAPGAQASYDSGYNGLMDADTAWKIVDDHGAIYGLNSFTPTKTANENGQLYPMAQLDPPSLLDRINSFFGG